MKTGKQVWIFHTILSSRRIWL
ncbi:MAG: hypothetical protein WDO15_11150 [Bacteroidota bacterium]